MQSIHEIEKWYETPDPWGYRTNPHDQYRRRQISDACFEFMPEHLPQYARALDIGAGEGWVSEVLPANEIHGLEISRHARERMPKRVRPITQPDGTYDLIVAAGVLYKHYDHQAAINMINTHSQPGTILVVAGIDDWLIPELSGLRDRWLKTEKFPYREYVQRVEAFRL